MSGIAVAYQRDGAPVADNMLRRMSDALAHRPADTCGQWQRGPVALAHRALYTTPEAVGEVQPLHDAVAQLTLTFDGRVDNRAELLKTLNLPSDTSDAALVLCAYERWGQGCPVRLLGDFAFALWDAQQQQLFCARDFLGLKPFYYYLDDKRFLCATELQQILAAGGVSREINEGMVGESLAASVTHREETLYRHIRRLLPGHSLRVTANGWETTAFWDGYHVKPVRYRRADEYAEHFQDVFQEAVRCRLRSSGPVGAHLSGGLDSTAVVAVARHLQAECAAFAQLFPRHPACDESAYSLDAAGFLQVNLQPIYPDTALPRHYEAQAQRYLDLPDYPNGSLGETMKKAIAGQGIRVVLTGGGGDECFSRAGHLWAELLRDGRFRTLARHFRTAFKAGPANACTQLLRRGLWPLLPATAHRLRHRRTAASFVETGLAGDFVRRINLAQRFNTPDDLPGSWSPAQKALYQRITDGGNLHGYEFEERSNAVFGLEERHPFLDRRVVELTLALPEEQRYQPGADKYIMRQALRGLLPEKVRQRTDKGDFSHVFPEALALCLPDAQALNTWRIVAEGWLDKGIAHRMLLSLQQLYAAGETGYTKYMWRLWMFYSVETWFRTLVPGPDLNSPPGNALAVAF